MQSAQYPGEGNGRWWLISGTDPAREGQSVGHNQHSHWVTGILFDKGGAPLNAVLFGCVRVSHELDHQQQTLLARSAASKMETPACVDHENRPRRSDMPQCSSRGHV